MPENLVSTNNLNSLGLPVPASVTQLCGRLSELASDVAQSKEWPQQSIGACRDGGVFRWFVPEKFGGDQWSESQILAGYLALSQSCLTTTFILTQWQAACRRILASPNVELVARIAPRLAGGATFTTVGISHLTTSRQHAAEPVLKAFRESNGYRLEGFSPWVTGAAKANLFVLGATLPDGSQILGAVPSDRSGVVVHPGQELIALSASCTDRVEFHGTPVGECDVLFGPAPNVMQLAADSGGATGGLQTSVLAIGLASAAVNYICEQSQFRQSLCSIADKLHRDVQRMIDMLNHLVDGQEVCTATEVRQQANSLVLRATQAALQTAKGAGFIAGHPAGRWAQEALFFLVWSCPQAVVDANLCELAGIEG